MANMLLDRREEKKGKERKGEGELLDELYMFLSACSFSESLQFCCVHKT